MGKQVLAFGKSEKSEFTNIGIFAASSGGRKGRRHIGRFTPGRERSHVWFTYNLRGLQVVLENDYYEENTAVVYMQSLLWTGVL